MNKRKIILKEIFWYEGFLERATDYYISDSEYEELIRKQTFDGVNLNNLTHSQKNLMYRFFQDKGNERIELGEVDYINPE